MTRAFTISIPLPRSISTPILLTHALITSRTARHYVDKLAWHSHHAHNAALAHLWNSIPHALTHSPPDSLANTLTKLTHSWFFALASVDAFASPSFPVQWYRFPRTVSLFDSSTHHLDGLVERTNETLELGREKSELLTNFELAKLLSWQISCTKSEFGDLDPEFPLTEQIGE